MTRYSLIIAMCASLLIPATVSAHSRKHHRKPIVCHVKRHKHVKRHVCRYRKHHARKPAGTTTHAITSPSAPNTGEPKETRAEENAPITYDTIGSAPLTDEQLREAIEESTREYERENPGTTIDESEIETVEVV